MLQENNVNIPPIKITDRQIEQVNCTRLLGVTVSLSNFFDRFIILPDILISNNFIYSYI